MVLVRTASARRSNEYPRSVFWAGIGRITQFLFFLPENFQFLDVRFSIYLNRRVFVMHNTMSIAIDRLQKVKF